MPRRAHQPPDLVDVHVGARLRVLRKQRGMSQEALGKALGLTFQQVQKYEKGANRVSASKLFAAAQLLAVSIESFFDGLPSPAAGGPTSSDELMRALKTDAALETAMRNLAAIRSPRDRKLLAQIIGEMAGSVTSVERVSD